MKSYQAKYSTGRSHSLRGDEQTLGLSDASHVLVAQTPLRGLSSSQAIGVVLAYPLGT